MKVVRAIDLKDHFGCAMEKTSSWQLEFTEDGTGLILRVHAVRTLEGHSKILYNSGREVTSMRARNYPLGGAAPYQLQPLRAYTIVTDTVLKEPLPEGVVASVIQDENMGVVMLNGQWDISLMTDNNILVFDIMTSVALTLGAMVPWAMLEFFDVADDSYVPESKRTKGANGKGSKVDKEKGDGGDAQT
jgi:hypothetical protein